MDLTFVVHRRADAALGLPPLRRLEQFRRHNRELRDVLDDPSVLRIWANDAFSSVRVFGHGDFVPDEPANVELILQNAVAALFVAVDRRGIPDASARSLDPVLIEALR